MAEEKEPTQAIVYCWHMKRSISFRWIQTHIFNIIAQKIMMLLAGELQKRLRLFRPT